MTQLAELGARAWRFDFYRAMRLLECAFPERPRLGHSRQPQDDAWRLGQMPSTAFPPSSLATVLPPGRARPQLLLVHLFGLLGPNGPMPLHITEYVIDRLRGNYAAGGSDRNAPDPTLARFLDLFHHRLLSLLWRAHADAEPLVEADRPAHDRFAHKLATFAGFRRPPAGPDARTIAATRRFWIGHLSRQSKNAEGLATILQHFFALPIAVEQFVGRWLPMPGRERCRLGGAALGRASFLGDEFWKCTQTIRIVLGPLSRARYESLLPGGPSWRRLGAIVRDYLGLEFAWEAALVLHKDEVPPCRFDARVRLAWTTWLGDRPPEHHRRDLVLASDATYRHRCSPADANEEP